VRGLNFNAKVQIFFLITKDKYFYFKFIFAGCFAIYGKQYIFVVPHQPNIALGYCVKFPRCILIYDAGGLFISYSDNTTICKFRRNIRFPILLLFYPAFLMRTAWLLSIKPGIAPRLFIISIL
jgi:hypothetical protein